MTLVPLALVVPMLVYVAYKDIVSLTIPNRAVLLTLGLAACTLPVFAMDELPLRLLAATLVFAVLVAMFAVAPIGGGDVKFLPVLVLFVPPDHWQSFGLSLSAALVLGVGIMSGARVTLGRSQPTGWEALDTPKAFPMGLSIALAGLATLVWAYSAS